MDKLTQYQTLITQCLSQHADLINQSSQKDVETHTIFDETNNRYMVFRTGWRGKERVQRAILYTRLQNGKIWIEEDWTENGIATDFLKAGVPSEDIVLAFHHPKIRSYTEFPQA